MDTRRAIVVATSAYVLGMAAQTTFVFLLIPTYARARGVPDAEMLAYGVNALAATAVGLAAGRLADRVPRRRVMRLGWGLEALAALALAMMPGGVTALVTGAALMGFGLSYAFVGFQSYLADLLRSQGLARAYGVTGALSVLGGAIGPLLAGRAIAIGGDTAASFLVAALAILAFLLTIPLRAAHRIEVGPSPPPRVGFATAALFAFHPRGVLSATATAGIGPYVVAFAVLGLGYGITAPWMGPHLLDAHGLTAAALGTLVAVATLVGAGSIYVAGRVAERYGRTFELTLAVNAGVAASLVVFALAPGLFLALAMFIVRQVGANPTGPILNAGLVRDAGAEARGSALGTTTLAWNLPWAAGAFLGGALRGSLGGWIFILGAACVVVGPMVALWMRAHERARGAGPAAATAGST